MGQITHHNSFKKLNVHVTLKDSFEAENVTMETILNEIEIFTGFYFLSCSGATKEWTTKAQNSK